MGIHMRLIPSDSLETLEFHKIKDLLAGYCYGQPGKNLCLALIPTVDPETIRQELKIVAEAKAAYENDEPLRMHHYVQVDEEMGLLKVPDFVLSEEQVTRLRGVLEGVDTLRRYFTEKRREMYPILYVPASLMPDSRDLLAAIHELLDDEGKIKPGASPLLRRLSGKMRSKKGELESVFRKLIQAYQKEGFLTDSRESIRNGRRVLSVIAEHKRKVRGIIHDESAKGRTTFIEPEAAIEINNDLFDLQSEYRKEIYRLLKELCGRLAAHLPDFELWQETLARYDTVQARARLAVEYDGTMPELHEEPWFDFRDACHPLLLIKNSRAGLDTIRFSLRLTEQNHILLLSGPNAGGKTVLMKAVGLLQIMAQSGLLIPASEQSAVGIFNGLFVELGDQQSLEDDLSTYSSRLKHMKEFAENADGKTLVLMDEFGSGTDPKLGGAIAEAILHQLKRKGVYGVMTTHYSDLKSYAYKTQGIVNGAMVFDKEKMKPVYKLRLGRPGSSFTFEIASKSGLDAQIINYAKKKAGKSQRALEELLADLQQQNERVTELETKLAAKEKKLDQLIRNYESLQSDLNIRKKKFKLQEKERDYQKLSDFNKELERTIRQIREEKNIELAKQSLEQVKQARAENAQTINNLNSDIYDGQEEKQDELVAGSYVRLRKGDAVGMIERIDKKRAIVNIGALQVTVPLRDLIATREPVEVKQGLSINSDLVNQNSAFDPKLDIRGMSSKEALETLELFMDQAIMTNTTTIRIIHGKGSGVLRRMVRKKLEEYPDCAARHPEAERGGDGVTIIEF